MVVMLHIQCSAITTQSIFSQILTIDTPPIAREGDTHYTKLSRAMRAPWVYHFLNNEIYCYPLSKKLEGIVASDRQQGNAYGVCAKMGSDLFVNSRITALWYQY